MADISSSAAKEHLLKGSGEIQRVSKEAVEAARDAGQRFLAAVGREAGALAAADGRKTVMPADVSAAAAKVMPGVGAGSAPDVR